MSERALDGLKQVMTVKSREVLPYLVPKLIAPPVNTRALSFLSVVAGDSLTKHLPKILPALQTSLSSKTGSPEETEVKYFSFFFHFTRCFTRSVVAIMPILLTVIDMWPKLSRLLV